MQKYRDNITIQGRGGLAPVRNANVTVYNNGTNDKAIIYQNVQKTPKANPFQGDALGAIFFYAENGRYDLFIQGDGQELRINDILMEDVWEDVDQLEVDVVAVEGVANNALGIANNAVPKPDLANSTDPAKGAAMVGYNEYQSVREAIDDVVTFERFGGGKGADDAALVRLVTYLNARSTGCVVRFDGSYKFTQFCPVKLTRSGVMFGGRGIVDLTSLPLTTDSYLLTVEGSGFDGVQTTLTANWDPVSGSGTSAGTGVVLDVVDTTGFEVGAYVTVTSIEYEGGISGASGFRPVGRGRLRRICSIPDATHLVLDQGPGEPFDAVAYTVYVRQLHLMEGFSVHDLTFVGPYETIGYEAADRSGPGVFFVQYVHGYCESGLCVSNFQAQFSQVNMSDRQVARDNIYKNTWTGTRSFSVRNPVHINWDFERGRRAFDYDSKGRPFAGVETREEVQTENTQVLGGFFRNCVSGVGGHMTYGLFVNGAVIRDAEVGIHNRLKHTSIFGCDIDVYDKGVVLGLGSSGVENSGSYTELTNAGRVFIDSSTSIRAISRGIVATSGWDSFECYARIEARNALAAFGKMQSNVQIRANFKGTDPAATYGGYCFGLGATRPLEANNIIVSGGVISGTNRAVWHRAAQSQVRDFRVDSVLFDNVNTNNVRIETGGADIDIASCSVQNCTYTGTLATSPVGGYVGAHPAMWEANNSWSRRSAGAGVVSGVLTVLSGADTCIIELAPGTNTTVTSIVGGKQGQILTIRNIGPGTMGVNSNPPLIRINGTFSSAGPGSIIVFLCVNTAGTQWVEMSRLVV